MPAAPRLAVQAPAPARPGVRAAVLALTLSAGCMGGAAAQGARPAAAAPLLSSPLPPGLPSGAGAGYHSPASPIAPLPPRTDVLPWSVLADLTRKTTKNGVLPVFSARQLSMHQTVQRIQGFMVPLDSRAAQTHFLLTSVPLTCPFCLPGGPESMVEVRTRTPVRYAIEPVVVQGRFTLLHDDPYGLYYRVLDAVAVE